MSSEDRPRQLPLGFEIVTGLAPDDLVVTAANQAAVRMIEAWPDWPSRVVVLAGPEGSGKSHLAAIWRQRSRARVVPANAIPAAGPQEARAWLIEDADRPGLDEVGLFHLVNSVRAASGSLLLTARRPPTAWNVRLPDLASRLRAAALAEILPPDDALLSAVIVKLFADRQIDVAAQVVEYLVARMPRSLVDAIRLVDRIDRWSLERQCRITRALAAEALQDTDINTSRG